MKRVTTIAILVAALAGCGRMTPPHATAADAERGQVALADLQEGRSLLVRKCGGCHQPPMPMAHTAHDWPKMIDEMRSRANLDARQQQLILQYLTVMNEAPSPATQSAKK
jgi:cytochrome c553